MISTTENSSTQRDLIWSFDPTDPDGVVGEDAIRLEEMYEDLIESELNEESENQFLLTRNIILSKATMIITATQNASSMTGFPTDNGAGICPEGNMIMTNVAIKETAEVERPKYSNPNEMEKVNMIRFLFGFKKDGKEYFAQTREMRQSGSTKSALMKFLTSWLGKTPPTDGSFDTEDLVNRGAQVTISHQVSPRGTKYAAITGISPVLDSNKDQIIDGGEFTIPGDDPEYKKPTGDDSVPY